MPSVMNSPRASRGNGRRSRPMSEINVTPFVDVMLVLLIVFMVTAPLLTAGVPIDLPQTRARLLGQDREPLAVSIDNAGKVFLQNTEIAVVELVPKRGARGLFITEGISATSRRADARGTRRIRRQRPQACSRSGRPR